MIPQTPLIFYRFWKVSVHYYALDRLCAFQTPFVLNLDESTSITPLFAQLCHMFWLCRSKSCIHTRTNIDTWEDATVNSSTFIFYTLNFLLIFKHLCPIYTSSCLIVGWTKTECMPSRIMLSVFITSRHEKKIPPQPPSVISLGLSKNPLKVNLFKSSIHSSLFH